MPDGKWIDLDVRQPGMRRILEALRQIEEEAPGCLRMPRSLRANCPERAATAAACLSEDAMSLLMLGLFLSTILALSAVALNAGDGDGFSNA